MIMRTLSKLFVYCIRIYQLFASPLFTPCCRFYPTCSQYAIVAIKTYGPFKGLTEAVKRLLRCHPFNPGGYDPVK